MRSKLDLTSSMKVTSAMIFCVLLYLQQVRIAESGVRWLKGIVDDSYAYTPIPSIPIGSRRTQLVEYWRALLHCILSDEAKYGLVVQFRLEGMKLNLKTHSRSGLAGQIGMKRNMSSGMGEIDAIILLFTVL